MLVLHGFWSPERGLCVWAEDSERAVTSREPGAAFGASTPVRRFGGDARRCLFRQTGRGDAAAAVAGQVSAGFPGADSGHPARRPRPSRSCCRGGFRRSSSIPPARSPGWPRWRTAVQTVSAAAPRFATWPDWRLLPASWSSVAGCCRPWCGTRSGRWRVGGPRCKVPTWSPSGRWSPRCRRCAAPDSAGKTPTTW